MIWNTGSFNLQPKSISVITVQTPTELNTKHTYAFDASDDLPLGHIPLSVVHKINHKYQKSLNILHTQHHMW